MLLRFAIPPYVVHTYLRYLVISDSNEDIPPYVAPSNQ